MFYHRISELLVKTWHREHLIIKLFKQLLRYKLNVCQSLGKIIGQITTVGAIALR